jgi:signal transduction histidine kinase
MAQNIFDQLAHLHETGLTGIFCGGLTERVHAIVGICKRLATIDMVCLHLVPTVGTQACVAAGAPQFPSGKRDIMRWIESGSGRDALTQVAASGKAFYMDPVAGELPSGPGPDGTPSSFPAAYLVPLGPREEIVGVLCAAAVGTGGIPREIRRVLDLLAPLFALAVENAQLCEQLQLSASPDPGSGANPEAAVLSPPNAFARLAHDIKNSMTTVSTFIQLLPAKWHDDHFRTTFYPAARDDTIRVNSLVNTLLDHGKQQYARLAIVDLPAMMNDLLVSKTLLADERHLRFRVRAAVTSPTVRINRNAIEEAIVNILTNAMEASPEGAIIDICLEDHTLQSGRPAIRIEIRDKGPGIDQSMQGAIFATYMTTKNRGDLMGGTGLGLSIARHHIEAHGGAIEVESPEGAGALFRVILPLERRRG